MARTGWFRTLHGFGEGPGEDIGSWLRRSRGTSRLPIFRTVAMLLLGCGRHSVEKSRSDERVNFCRHFVDRWVMLIILSDVEWAFF